MYRDVVDVHRAGRRAARPDHDPEGRHRRRRLCRRHAGDPDARRRSGRKKRIGFELIIETALGMANVARDRRRPAKRNESLHFGVADYAASTRARTTSIGGANPDYAVLTDKAEDGARDVHWGDMWHYAIARMVVAARANGLRPIDGPFGDFSDADGYRAAGRPRRRCWAARASGRSIPSQVALANEVFTPAAPPRSTKARRILEAMEQAAGGGQGRGRARRPADRHRLDPPGRGPGRQGRADRGRRGLSRAPARDRAVTGPFSTSRSRSPSSKARSRSCATSPTAATSNIAEEVARLADQGRAAAAADLRQAHRLAEDAGRAPSRAAAFLRLRRRPDRGLHAARRRPRLRRRPRDPWAASAAFAAARSSSSATRRAPTPKAACATISAWRSPEGYRKAARLMQLAERFGLPVVTLVDTPGAYPGVDAEARGQAEAIARAIETCLKIARAARRRHHRRGRLGRRHRARRRQPRPDAGARGLFGDLARGLRLDPVAQRRPGAGGGRGAEADRPGSAEPRRHRRDRPGAARRRPSRARRHGGSARRRHRGGADRAASQDGPSLRARGGRSSSRWDGTGSTT